MDTDEPKLSKAEKKKLNKKLKAENGKLVATGEEQSPAKEEKKDKKAKKEKEGKKVKVVEKEGGLKLEDHKVGSGPQAKRGDRVSMRYIGKLTNGKEFDKNTGGKPVSNARLYTTGYHSLFMTTSITLVLLPPRKGRSYQRLGRRHPRYASRW